MPHLLSRYALELSYSLREITPLENLRQRERRAPFLSKKSRDQLLSTNYTDLENFINERRHLNAFAYKLHFRC